MGQLIAFPPARRKRDPRFDMALEVLCGLTYALGLFLFTPVLALVALGGIFAGEPLTSLGALALLALVWPLTAAARRRV
jgi:hypothetical protein